MKLISSAALAAVSLFAASAALAQTKPTAPAINMVIGNATARDTYAATNDKFAELVTKYSRGRIKATAHHGGSLGGNPQMFASLQAGAVHGMITPAGIGTTAVPELSLFDLPFLLPGAPAKITAFAAQSKAAAKLMELAEQKGMHIIGFHGVGPLSFLTRFPVNQLADIQGKKLRLIPSPPRVGTFQDWGIIGRPMDLGEVYTALQQGNIDGLALPPDIIYKMKFYEAARNFTITEHSVFVSAVFVSKKWYDGLPKDLQQVVTRAGKETIVWADDAFSKAQDSSLESMKKVIAVTNMPPAELQKMKDLTRKGVWERIKADPQRNALMKLLEEDFVRFASK